MSEIAFIPFKQTDQKSMSRVGLHLQLPAVQSEEDVRSKEGYPLVPVDKSMVHQERLKKRRPHFDQVLIITSPGAVKRAFEKTQVPDAFQSTKPLDQPFMDGKNLVKCEVVDDLSRQGVSPTDRFLS